MTNKQKRVALRVLNCIAGLAVIAIAAFTHSYLPAIGFILGAFCILMILAEVMNKADERAAADVEEFRRNLALIRAAAAGIKPKPPGVEYIREGSDPVERP